MHGTVSAGGMETTKVEELLILSSRNLCRTQFVNKGLKNPAVSSFVLRQLYATPLNYCLRVIVNVNQHLVSYLLFKLIYGSSKHLISYLYYFTA